jgi:hypothetical protein
MTVGGVTACKTQEDYELIKFYQNMHGNIMSPMVAFLTLQVCHVKTGADCAAVNAIAALQPRRLHNMRLIGWLIVRLVSMHPSCLIGVAALGSVT